jgi:two-component system LytT family response regulator
MKYKAIIIDDEPDAVQFIAAILADHCPGISLAGSSHSVVEGYRMISEIKPDIVFLDVEMPQGSGFDLLKMFPFKSFEVIFVTAYNHYAIEAIRFSAFDYILKPVGIRDLISAVQRFIDKKESSRLPSGSFSTLFENLKNKLPGRLAISTTEGYEYLDIDEIIRIEAEGSYSRFFLTNGRKILVSKPLKDFHEILTTRRFFRPHNSHLINLVYVRKYLRNDASVFLSDGSSVPISRSKKGLFTDIMEGMSVQGN